MFGLKNNEYLKSYKTCAHLIAVELLKDDDVAKQVEEGLHSIDNNGDHPPYRATRRLYCKAMEEIARKDCGGAYRTNASKPTCISDLLLQQPAFAHAVRENLLHGLGEFFVTEDGPLIIGHNVQMTDGRYEVRIMNSEIGEDYIIGERTRKPKRSQHDWLKLEARGQLTIAKAHQYFSLFDSILHASDDFNSDSLKRMADLLKKDMTKQLYTGTFLFPKHISHRSKDQKVWQIRGRGIDGENIPGRELQDDDGFARRVLGANDFHQMYDVLSCFFQRGSIVYKKPAGWNVLAITFELDDGSFMIGVEDPDIPRHARPMVFEKEKRLHAVDSPQPTELTCTEE